MGEYESVDPLARPSGDREDPDGEVHVERVERDSAGRLVAHLSDRDQPVVDVRVARCFPWSVPDQYVSLRDADGREVALLKNLEELDSASRDVVERELADKIFNPKIKKIISFNDEFGVVSITAETDRGTVTFQVRGRDDVRVLSSTRALLRDADGNCYELEDIRKLDGPGRQWMSRYF